MRSQGCRAAFVLSGIGSLADAGLRFAGADQPQRMTGATEILSLSGTVAINGSDSGSRSLRASQMLRRGMTSWWYGRLMSQTVMSSLDKKAANR